MAALADDAHSPGHDGLPADLAAAVALGGEMGARFAGYDWAAHPLGPPADWPPEWRAAVAIALTSRFPIVLWLGPDLYLLYNDAYIPALDQKHPAALGMAGRDAWAEIWDPIGPMLTGVLATGKATWNDDLMLALVSDGVRRERYFTFTYSPIIAQDGPVTGVFCAVAETTERVLSERRLRLLTSMAAELFHTRTVAEAVNAVVRVCDGTHPDLPFLAVYVDEEDKPGTLAGASEPVRDRLPASLSALLPDGVDLDAERPLLLDVNARLGPAVPDVEHGPQQALLVRLAGAQPGSGDGALLLGLSALRPLDEQYRGFCRLVADQISAALASAGSFELERRRADALAQLDHAKTVFLTNVSHEFRTPLSLVLGPLEDAIAAERDATQRERLESAQRNAARLLRLVNSLLEFARTESGRADAKPVRADLGALTAQIASSFTELCRRAGVELVLDCAPAPAEVDPQMWETIVLNLLSNAVKFTFSGSITVRVESPDRDSVEVTVTDTGTGIPAEDMEHLFERFYQARNPRARSMEGSGIGLSLVRSLVELHGGTITLDSTEDLGTSVRIRMPAAGEADEREPRGVAEAGVEVGAWAAFSPVASAYVAETMQWLEFTNAAPDQSVVVESAGSETGAVGVRRSRVLIVDDNADMRRHLVRVCSAFWDVEVAGDGESALAAMRRRRPDVVVTDVMMPTLDGLGLVAAIRADPQLSSLPVVMLSARAGVEAAGAGLAAGADDYLPKPFSSVDLVNRIAARLDKEARERQRREREQAEARQAAALAESAAALSAATSVPEVLAALLAGPAGLGASSAALGVLDPETGTITISYAGDVPARLRERYHSVAADAPLPLAQVIRSAQPIIIADVDEIDPEFAQVVRESDPFSAAVIYPLRDRVGAVVAAVRLGWPRPRAFPRAQLELVEQAVLGAGQALDRIHVSDREHRIAAGFQEHHLDLDRRSRAGVLGAVYQPAAEMMRVGGDWYLAAPLPDAHRLAISVGDAVGHGLLAATVMSRLRSAAAAATLTDPSPGFVLDLLDRYAGSVPGAACTTVAYAVVDTAAGMIDYACAGHPYPLLVTESGDARYLTEGRRPPLTIGHAHEARPQGRSELPPGSLLLLYTDGLIERPGESLDEGFDRLLSAAGRLTRQPVDAVCARLLEAMAPPGGYRDDVALLALRPAGVTPDSFVVALPAGPLSLPDLRARMRVWLDGLRLSGPLSHDVLLTVCEAVANSIEHGSRSDPRHSVSVEVFAEQDLIRASVSDPGRWASDASAGRRTDRGAGLTLIYGLSDEVEIARGTGGTRVTMLHRRYRAPKTRRAAGVRR